jgi:hypothetical protein
MASRTAKFSKLQLESRNVCLCILVKTERRNAFPFISSLGLKMLFFRCVLVLRKGERLSNDRSRDWIRGDDDNV